MRDIPDILTYTGDTSPDITFTVYRGDAIVDLTNCSVIFKLFSPSTNAQTNQQNQQCIVSDPTNGQCIYIWGTNDKPTRDIYKGFLQITFQDGTIETAKVRVDVQEVGF